MKLELYSYNSNVFGTTYKAFILYPKPLRGGADASWLELSGTYPQLTGKTYQGQFLTIQIRYEDDFANVHLREDEIKQWFNTTDATPHKLIAKDTADGNRLWYCNATPLSVMQSDNSAIISLALDTPFWYVNTPSTDTWSIIGDTGSKTITCIGETAEPILTITSTIAKGVGYLYSRFVEITPPSTTATLTNFPLNLGPFNTAALVSGSKAQSSGADFRIFADGVEIPRWFGTGAGAFNTTTTNIWVVLSYLPKVALTLRANISSSPITQLLFANTTANKTAINKLPASGILRIGTEYFTYSGKDAAKVMVTGVVRAAKNSTAASHTAGDAILWIQHDVWMVYGNPAADEPVYSDNQKPMFDLDSSTSSSWVYSEFFQSGRARAGGWSKALLSSTLKSSAPYTGSHGAMANPATEAGLRMATAAINGVQKAETASLVWTLNCPAGITTITITGAKYRFSTGWPTVVFQKSTNGTTYTVINTQATPAAAKTWTAFTISGLSLAGTFPFLRFSMSGTLAALASNEADAEIQSATITVDSTNVPAVSLKTENSAYYLDATITNNTTGEAIKVTWSMKLNETITVNCKTRRVTYSDGTRIQSALTLDSDRVDWLNLVNGVNQLQWDDVGTLGVTIALSWSDMVAI